MSDPHDPLRRPPLNPGVVEKPDLPETEAPEHDFPEGQLPGMPLSRDPILNPGPGPTEVEQFPQD